MRPLELLAPARDAAIGRIAILAGADAVYIGAPAFGARAAATNDIESIAGLTAFAHRFRAKVYVTMNTIIYDSEIDQARDMVWQLYAAGVDALIVQDMAYLMMDLPPIALHASTQCDIRTPEKARRLARAGFSQLVLPREFSLSQIAEARQAAGIPVEIFVHGALCVSYSGDCQAGFMAMSRSANRGECPQMCRLPYELTDAAGNAVGPEKHYLSLRDLNRMESLGELADAGASSFKIEGRLKDARYVANVTAAYSRALDSVVASSGGKYCRASAGRSTCNFAPDLNRTFNRGYTSYFLKGRDAASRMASLDTPKWAGMPVGTVVRTLKNGAIEARLTCDVANGDGLGFFDADGRFNGFRLNKAQGATLYPASPQAALRPGMKLYRNNDKAFFDLLDSTDAGCSRTIDVSFTVEPLPDGFVLSATDSRGCSASAVTVAEISPARTDQTEARRKTLGRLGDTIYRLADVDDRMGDSFVAASVLTAARRSVIAMLDADAGARYSYDRRKPSELTADELSELKPLTYHDNVANSLAHRFYTSHGATVGEEAVETRRPDADETTVMTTRYCIRRELGCCLREKGGTRLPSPLFLRNPSGIYRLDFDCARCGMSVVKCNKNKL
ncbi:MAG: U32 family peptidase [Muribaculaceae bacterium]|nr:U32 family peptidase [Muribaculaceae bacterium]